MRYNIITTRTYRRSLENSSLFSATLSMITSDSREKRMSLSVAINIKASKCSCDSLLLSLVLMNLSVENVRSQATRVIDRVSRNLYARPRRW